MHDWPRAVIGILWILWAIYWGISALGVKAVRSREPLGSRLLFVIPMVLVALLLLVHRGPPWLLALIVPGGWDRYGSGVALVVVGLGFSVWARAVLGGNWSGTVTVKVEHELVQRGPYRRIRHPIYTGLLFALLGSGLAAGRIYGLLAFLVALIALVRKLRVEERYMEGEFGERYAAYRRSSWALLPWVY
jgi:protein-S-isoprenylcysteine O-methyltransferase Ste14